MSVLRRSLQFCILGVFAASMAIYRPTELAPIAGICSFFGLLFSATFLLGTGAAEKLTERKLFLATESFALVVVVGGVLSATGNLFFALVAALIVWWGLMVAFLVHPAFGYFEEEKEFFHSLPPADSGTHSLLRRFLFAFLYAPIFVKKDVYFWGLMALATLYLIGKYFR